MALQQQGSVTTKGQEDAPGLGCCLENTVMSEDYEELSPALTWASWEGWLCKPDSRRPDLAGS